MDSLADRADVQYRIVTIHELKQCSEYGDTDREIAVHVGGEGGRERLGSRYAEIQGLLVCHRTQGGASQWRLGPFSLVTRGADGGLYSVSIVDPYVPASSSEIEWQGVIDPSPIPPLPSDDDRVEYTEYRANVATREACHRLAIRLALEIAASHFAKKDRLIQDWVE